MYLKEMIKGFFSQAYFSTTAAGDEIGDTLNLRLAEKSFASGKNRTDFGIGECLKQKIPIAFAHPVFLEKDFFLFWRGAVYRLVHNDKGIGVISGLLKL